MDRRALKICIIGRGNVATHLNKAFSALHEVAIADPHNSADWPRDADLYIISVTDSAIESVASEINTDNKDAVVAHTAGSVEMDTIQKYHTNAGVFYPMQTFSKNIELSYSEIPIFIEGANRKVADTLSNAASFSRNVRETDSAMRQRLHLASVFACNFTNRLWDIADHLLKEFDLDISILQPLINETTRKIRRVSPHDAQTGPAVRFDKPTIDKHLSELSSKPEYFKIYDILTQSIQKRDTDERN